MVDVISVRALAGLALLVPLQLWAQSAERPQLRPGDRWQFVEYQTVPSRVPNREWVITGASAAGFEGRENGEPLLLDAELNTLESPRARYSSLRSLRFPMSVGAEWRYDSDWLFKATGSSGTSSSQVQVRTVVRSVTHNPYVGTTTVELVTYGPWKQ